MQLKQFIVLLASVILGASSASADAMHPMTLMPDNIGTRLSSNITFFSDNEAINKLVLDKHGLSFINPSKILEKAVLALRKDDIVEDLKDPFMMTSGGKPRPNTVDSNEEWADEELVANHRRTKRCSDDYDDVNTARRGRGVRGGRRRRRRARRTRTARKEVPVAQSATTTTTTITRKVIQNGQVVSETSQTGGGLQQPVTVVQHQPEVVQHLPVVQVVPHQQAAQPIVVQHQPSQQVLTQPAGGAVTLPSVAVQGAVKVN